MVETGSAGEENMMVSALKARSKMAKLISADNMNF